MSDNENNENPDNTDPLTWGVTKNDLLVEGTHETVRLMVGAEVTVLSVEDARELFTHALVHMGGRGRPDTAVADVALELCMHHAHERERVEKRLADLQEKYALQARILGEHMGRLKKYE